jgi:hypothetical protein
VLTNSDGKPWSESGFQGAWGKATTRAGICGLTFHDLRGTAVVTLARADCNEVEIYSITGHKPGDVRAILTTHYLPRDAEVAGNAIAKLNAYKTGRGDQKEDKNLPTTLPTVPECSVGEAEKTSVNQLAGAPGLEPGNGGIKIRCLTTWLRPNSGIGRWAGGP